MTTANLKTRLEKAVTKNQEYFSVMYDFSKNQIEKIISNLIDFLTTKFSADEIENLVNKSVKIDQDNYIFAQETILTEQIEYFILENFGGEPDFIKHLAQNLTLLLHEERFEKVS